MKLGMVLRWYGVSFVIGLLLVVLGGYGLYVYEPIPESVPFTTPLPYNWIFAAAMLIGGVLVARAWIKGSRLTK